MQAHAAAYIRARCIANPFVLFQFVQIGVLRACKDARTPLYAVLIANISNLVMDILFVFGFNMGASGAALATSISQVLSCSILFGVLRQRCAGPPPPHALPQHCSMTLEATACHVSVQGAPVGCATIPVGATSAAGWLFTTDTHQ